MEHCIRLPQGDSILHTLPRAKLQSINQSINQSTVWIARQAYVNLFRNVLNVYLADALIFASSMENRCYLSIITTHILHKQRYGMRIQSRINPTHIAGRCTCAAIRRCLHRAYSLGHQTRDKYHPHTPEPYLSAAHLSDSHNRIVDLNCAKLFGWGYSQSCSQSKTALWISRRIVIFRRSNE